MRGADFVKQLKAIASRKEFHPLAASILTFENGTNAIISAKSFVFILFVVFKVNKKVCTAKLEPLKTTDKFSGDYLYTVLHKSDITNVNPPINRGLLRG